MRVGLFSKSNLLERGIPIFIFLFLTILSALFFFGASFDGRFFFPHDSQQYSSIEDIRNRSFLLYNLNDDLLRKIYNIAPAMNIVNGIFYYAMLAQSIPIDIANFIFYVAIQFFILTLSFFGIRGIYSYLFLKNSETSLTRKDSIAILVVTSFYFLNPFNILSINTGIFFSLTYIAYGLIPYFVLYLLRMLNGEMSFGQSIIFSFICTWIVFQMTFVIPILVLSLALLLLFKIEKLKFIFLRIGTVFLVVSLLTLPVTVPFLIHSSGEDFIQNSLVGGAEGSIKGGVLTMLKSHFSWIIYTIWEPRSVITFHEYLDSAIFVLASIGVYAFILAKYVFYRAVRAEEKALFLALILAILFSKGGNPPFGEIFSFLVEHFSVFGSVRSPDNKFSVVIPIVLSVLLLAILNREQRYPKKYWLSVFFIFTSVVIFSVPFFSREAVISRSDYPRSGEYFFSKPREYSEFIELVNSDSESYNIASFPEYNGILVHDREMFIGRDVLATFVEKPFVYFLNTEQGLLKGFLSKGNIEEIGQLNVKYVLFRKDIFIESQKNKVTFQVKDVMDVFDKSANFQKVVDNKYLSMYKVGERHFQKKLFISNLDNQSFSAVDVTKYKLSAKSLKRREVLYFSEGFNSDYKIFFGTKNLSSFRLGCLFGEKLCLSGENLSYLWRNPLPESFHEGGGVGINSWILDPEYIKQNFPKDQYHENADGSIDLELTLYFKPQSYFYLGLIISGTALVLCLGYLGVVGVRGWKQKKNESRPKSSLNEPQR